MATAHEAFRIALAPHDVRARAHAPGNDPHVVLIGIALALGIVLNGLGNRSVSAQEPLKQGTVLQRTELKSAPGTEAILVLRTIPPGRQTHSIGQRDRLHDGDVMRRLGDNLLCRPPSWLNRRNLLCRPRDRALSAVEPATTQKANRASRAMAPEWFNARRHERRNRVGCSAASLHVQSGCGACNQRMSTAIFATFAPLLKRSEENTRVRISEAIHCL